MLSNTPFSLRLLAGVSFLQALSFTSAADVIGAASDTFLETGNFPSDTVHGAMDSPRINELWSYNNGGAYHAAPLLRFDLESYAGKTVESDATLTLHVKGYNPNAEARVFDLVPLTGPFNPETASWNNSRSLANGTVIGTFTKTLVADQPFTLTLPAATIQSWIDAPESNFGFAIMSMGYVPDVYFYSSEAGEATQPTLTFNAVPEPSAAALAGIGLLGLASRRRRASESR